ncbi:MAG: M4 family metallopeptidase [Bacteroidota bacterium]
MKRILYSIFAFALISSVNLHAQKKFKDIKKLNKTYNFSEPIKLNIDELWTVPTSQPITKYPTSPLRNFQPLNIPGRIDNNFKVKHDPITRLPILLQGKAHNQNTPVDGVKLTWKDKAVNYLSTFNDILQIESPAQEFEVVKVNIDALQMTHIRLQQKYKGLKVYGGELIVHAEQFTPYMLNGRYYPTPEIESLTPSISANQAEELALDDVAQYTPVSLPAKQYHKLFDTPVLESELVVYHKYLDHESERLAYVVNMRPNLTNRWRYFIDAQTGEVIMQYQLNCKFASSHSHAPKNDSEPEDTPITINATNVRGGTSQINVLESQGTFYMVDITQPMFDAQNSGGDNGLIGAIVTYDGMDGNIEENLSLSVVSSTNNQDWSGEAVSAHANAEFSYNYYRNTFSRNSINGNGGTINSIVNIQNADGTEVDNAFWGGGFMVYGSGNIFDNFTGALDIAGHEMSHGVIENTANLEYMFQSGALNESFADVFGVMIDRDDWQQGEDITPTNVAPSGAIRDLSNPNNNSAPGSFTWQPKDMDEFQNLGADEDNGGVHINSGIPNFAFFKIATAIGKDKAEQIYYRALTTYLTRNSQFIDGRLAIIQSAQDLYGATEVNAARRAFDEVKIFDGEATETEVEVEENTGTEFILFTDDNNDNIYVYTTDGTPILDPAEAPAPLRPVSITDDGSLIIYVAKDNTLQSIQIDWANGNYQTVELDSDPIWGNASVSKDGTKVALTFNDQSNTIAVVDLVNGGSEVFELFNPTYAQGGFNTGTVKFADVLQWDFSGQFIMYDAFNEIPGDAFGDLSYWDIGFIEVWNNQTNSFGSGNIGKLFPGLTDGLSVGNPVFSKNSPNVIALDVFNQVEDTYQVYAVNIETYDQNTLWNNLDLGVPNFNLDDSQVMFSGFNNSDVRIIASVPLNADKISAANNAQIFFSSTTIGLKWPNIFSNGTRTLTSIENVTAQAFNLKTYPNPIETSTTVEFELVEAEEVRIELWDLLGRQLKIQDLGRLSGKIREKVELNGFSSGMYLMKVHIGNKLVSQKISKL